MHYLIVQYSSGLASARKLRCERNRRCSRNTCYSCIRSRDSVNDGHKSAPHNCQNKTTSQMKLWERRLRFSCGYFEIKLIFPLGYSTNLQLHISMFYEKFRISRFILILWLKFNCNKCLKMFPLNNSWTQLLISSLIRIFIYVYCWRFLALFSQVEIESTAD